MLWLIARRQFWGNKTFSLINISGLALGLAVFTLIMLWVKNEMSCNGFHQDSDVNTFPACLTLLV